MTDLTTLSTQIQEQFSDWITATHIAYGELTVDVKQEHIADISVLLRDKNEFEFKLLLDICGVDYLHYGYADWETESTTETGFSRGVTAKFFQENPTKPNRFAVVYHLLSLTHNRRIRLKVNLANDSDLIVDSVNDIWPAANWFEREAFDLYGIVFRNHPDLRRILTDYGFIGHPFRKDFPLIGKVEPRYDAELRRVIYEPVSIELRVLEPKVIRHDHRYLVDRIGEGKDGK